jgi:hypothetical protein
MTQLKRFMVIAALGWGAAAGAATPVRMDFELLVKGETYRPRVLTNLGQAATISQTAQDATGVGYELKVMPTAGAGAEIHLDMELSELAGGKKRLLSQPRIVVLDGEKAAMSMSNDGGERIAITVTPSTRL